MQNITIFKLFLNHRLHKECPKIHARNNFDRKHRFIIKNCKFFIDS